MGVPVRFRRRELEVRRAAWVETLRVIAEQLRNAVPPPGASDLERTFVVLRHHAPPLMFPRGSGPIAFSGESIESAVLAAIDGGEAPAR